MKLWVVDVIGPQIVEEIYIVPASTEAVALFKVRCSSLLDEGYQFTAEEISPDGPHLVYNVEGTDFITTRMLK